MHRCLHIPEIVSLICDEISDVYSVPETDLASCDIGRRNYLERPMLNDYFLSYFQIQSRSSQLLALAQTCRLFQQPALQSLWSSLPSIANLIKCAGTDLLKSTKTGHVSQKVDITRPIAPSEAETIKKYASLVRHLHTNRHCVVASDAWRILQDTFEGTTLFPNLKTIDKLTDEMLLFPALFGTHNLTSLAVTRPHQPSRLLDFFVGCPNLTSLDLGRFREPDMLSIVRQALPKWPALTHLVSYWVTPEIAQIFANCPNLRHLIFTELADDFDLPPLSAASTSYPMLEGIDIGCRRIPDAIQFLNALPTTSNLQKLVVNISETSEVPMEETWLSLLDSAKKYARSLKELSVLATEQDIGYEALNITLSSTLLNTLASHFTALIRVKIFSLGNHLFFDDDVKTLTEALPLLEDFRLSFNAQFFEISDTYYEPSTSIACLAFFARNCPKLTNLVITFNAESEDIPALQPAAIEPRGMNLTSLDVSISPAAGDANKADEIAGFIDGIFPNLQWLDWEQYEDEGDLGDNPVVEFMTTWSDVSKILKEKKGGDTK